MQELLEAFQHGRLRVLPQSMEALQKAKIDIPKSFLVLRSGFSHSQEKLADNLCVHTMFAKGNIKRNFELK
jgi:hypothetical protein